MSAQPWQERRREYLEAKGRTPAAVVDINEFRVEQIRRKKGGRGRTSAEGGDRMPCPRPAGPPRGCA
jgi:hypothetical protein